MKYRLKKSSQDQLLLVKNFMEYINSKSKQLDEDSDMNSADVNIYKQYRIDQIQAIKPKFI